MNTGTAITLSQQAVLEQVLAAGITFEQLALLAQQAHNQSGAESDSEMVELWLKTRGKGKLRTVRAYSGDVSEFFAWLGGHTLTTVQISAKIHGAQVTEQVSFITGGKGIRALTAKDLQAYKDALAQSGHSPATQTRKMSAVRSLLSYAQKTGYSTFNVGAAVRPAQLSQGASHKRILSRDQVSAMIHHTEKERDRFLLRFLYLTGARINEVLSLTWRDVDLHQSAAVIHLWNEKVDAPRQVTLNESHSGEVLALLRKFKAQASSEGEPVFKSQKGGALDASQAFRIVRAAARRAGIEQNVSPHWLRHCHVAHSLNAGAPVHVVQKTVGHSSLDTTTGYADLLPGQTSADYL